MFHHHFSHLRRGRHANGRHALLHRFGGPGGLMQDDEPLVRGRRFSSDDLHVLLLAELRDRSSHGYELIKAIDARARGCYRPSPGVLYPALAFLEDTGLVEARSEQNRKSYSLTDAGRQQLAADAERVALLHARLAHLARKMERMQRALSGADGGDGSPPADGWLEEFVDARRALKRALLLRDGAGHDEQRRIAAILRETVARLEAQAAPEAE